MGTTPRCCRWACAPIPAATERSLPRSRPVATSTLVGSLSDRPPCLPRTHTAGVLLSGLSCPSALPTSLSAPSGSAIRFKVATLPLPCQCRQQNPARPVLPHTCCYSRLHTVVTVCRLFRIHFFTHRYLVYLVHLFREPHGPVPLVVWQGHLLHARLELFPLP